MQHIALAAFSLFTFLLFPSCDSSNKKFRLEGQFQNLDQGEFYLYNLEMGTKDTIAVNRGRFDYEISTSDTTILMLLFPNYSEIPIFASPGVKLKMNGDASHLRETEVNGSPDNDEMTAFRLRTNQMTPPETEQAAIQFITDNPASEVSSYLLRRYVLQSLSPDYAKACQLCSLMVKAQPHKLSIMRLNSQLQILKNNTTTGRLPSFTAIDTKGDTIHSRQLNKDANVIFVWAAWNYDSYNVFRRLKTLAKEHGNRLSVLAIDMEASPSESKKILERDSITWPNVCDSLLWQSPIIHSLGVHEIPANILTDKRGNIVGRNLSDDNLIHEVERLLNQ